MLNDAFAAGTECGADGDLATARAKRRFATLAQAIMSRKPTAARRARRVLANWPRMFSLIGSNSERNGGSGKI